ncbi:MAG: S24 family peptidase, partial [Fusobacteriaceae bacterium]
MEQTFYDGDIVILKKEVEVGIGEIGVFQNRNTGEALVKRLKKKNGVYILESDNHLFRDIEIKTDEIVCCGKVISVVKKDLKKRINPLIEKIEMLDPKQQEILEMMINGLLDKK